jgi:hypothetical protein
MKPLVVLKFMLVATIVSIQAIGQNTSPKTPDLCSMKLQMLPRPNSGKFTFEEAEKRKKEIYNLHPTLKFFDWENPTTGGAVHINKKDEIEVYQFSFGIYDYSDSSGVHYKSVHKGTSFVVQNSKDLLYHVGGSGFGNASSVLITSEIPLTESKAIKKIMAELWNPGIQIYYFVKKD